MNNTNLNAPAFPCVPIQDNFGRLIAAIPGITKLEYFTLKIYILNKSLIKDEVEVEAAINEAIKILNELEKYQNKQDEKTDVKILSVD